MIDALKMIAKRMALFLFCLLGAFLMAEWVFRLYAMHEYNEYASSWTDPLYQLAPGRIIEYSMKPGTIGTHVIPFNSNTVEWSYAINEDGFRGRNISHAKTGGIKRVVFLGDSYTFGWGVNDSDTFAMQMESMINRTPRQLESVNLGVPGYNTRQEYDLLAHEATNYQPDLVILSYIINDAEPQATVPINPRQTYRYARLWLLERLKASLNRLMRKQVFVVRLNKHNYDYRYGFRHDSPKGRASSEALTKMAAFCDERNWPLLVLILPDFNQDLNSGYCCPVIHQKVSQKCAELGVPVIDLLEKLNDTDHKDFMVPGDGHPNPYAHKRIAEIVQSYVTNILSLHEVVP